jgi:hypothetical protein
MSEWLRAYSAGLNTETDLPWAGQLTVEEALEAPPAGAGVMFDPDLED